MLRVQFLWKAEGTVDRALAGLRLGVTLEDLLPELSGSFRTYSTLRDVLCDAKAFFGFETRFRCAARCSIARRAVAALLEELLRAADEASALSDADVAEKARAHGRARDRTLASHGDLLAPGEVPLVGITGHARPRRAATAAREAHDAAAGSARGGLARALCRALAATKATSVDFAFRSLDALVLGSAAALSAVPARWARPLRSLLEPRGGPAAAWSRFREALAGEIAQLWAAVEAAEAAAAERAEARAKADADAWAAMTRDEKRRRRFLRDKAALAEKLGGAIARATGVEEKAAEAADEAPVDFGRRVRSEHAASVREALELYRLATSVLSGVTAAAAHSHRAKVEVALEGFDVFEPLP